MKGEAVKGERKHNGEWYASGVRVRSLLFVLLIKLHLVSDNTVP